MTAATLTPVTHTAATTLAKAFGPVPAGEEWSVRVRVCALGSVDSIADLDLRATGSGTPGYRAKAHPVAVGSGTYDLETNLTMPAGYELWDRSGAADVSFSYTGTKRSTT